MFNGAEWSDLHGEPERGKVDILSYFRRSTTRNGIYCIVCEDVIEFSEMKPWHKDNDTVDMLCPGCDSVLAEGE